MAGFRSLINFFATCCFSALDFSHYSSTLHWSSVALPRGEAEVCCVLKPGGISSPTLLLKRTTLAPWRSTSRDRSGLGTQSPPPFLPNHQVLFLSGGSQAAAGEGHSHPASRVKSSSTLTQAEPLAAATWRNAADTCRGKSSGWRSGGSRSTATCKTKKQKSPLVTTKEIYCNASVWNIYIQRKKKKKCQRTQSRRLNGSNVILPASFLLEEKLRGGKNLFVCVWPACI